MVPSIIENIEYCSIAEPPPHPPSKEHMDPHLTLFMSLTHNCLGGVMVNALASSVVDHGFKPWSGQTKDYTIGICSFSA